MDSERKAQENRLRRMATRRGYSVSKSRRRDPGALDYGRWQIVDDVTGRSREVADLDELAAFLDRHGRRQQ